ENERVDQPILDQRFVEEGCRKCGGVKSVSSYFQQKEINIMDPMDVNNNLGKSIKNKDDFIRGIVEGHRKISEIEMQRSNSFESIALGKDRFDVTVYPNVDYAFIVALVVILDQSKTYFSASSSTIEFLDPSDSFKHTESREVNPKVNNVPFAPLIPTSSNEIEKEESRSSPLASR
nr:protein LURP-one-related 15-like [Tanacetum cinerariifolium]